MKKFACFALSAVMLLGGTFGLSACDFGDEGDGNQGGLGSGVLSESVREELISSLSAYNVKGMEFTFEANSADSFTGGPYSPSAGKGVVSFSEEGVALDFFQGETHVITSSDGSGNVTESRKYDANGVFFLRGGNFYEEDISADEEVKRGEFEKFLETFRKEGGNVLRSEEAPAYLTSAKEIFRLAMNAMRLLDAEAKAADGGFELTVTADRAIPALAERATKLLDSISPSDKVASLLQKTEVVGLLSDLTNGRTAKEVVAAVRGMFPELPVQLPEPEDDKETPFDYVVDIASDEAFFASAMKRNPFEGTTTFSELTISEVSEALEGISGEELLKSARDYVNEISQKNGLAKLFFGEKGALGFTITVGFDKQKQPTGISASMDFTRTNSGRSKGEAETTSSQISASLTFCESVQLTDLSACYARYFDDESGESVTKKVGK